MDIIKISDLPEGSDYSDAYQFPASTGPNPGDVKRFTFGFWRTLIQAWITTAVAGITRGPQGPAGAPGSQGLTGPQGPKGDKGDTGAQGTKGDAGQGGSIGIQGPKGDKGDKGDTGAQGTQGIQGNTGADGATGADGPGVAAGGTTGQILRKVDGTDFNTEWDDLSFVNIDGQPTDNAAMAAALGNKVDKVTGYGLSQANYTSAEKTKLANLSEHFKGTYTTAAALTAANPTGNAGDYGFVDAGTGADAKMYIWDATDNVWVLSSGTGTIPDATETSSGIVALATVAQALAGTDDAKAMTALKVLDSILNQKKNVNYQIAPVSLNEVSFLMLNAGNITGITISGASNAKLKTGLTGVYPSGAQTFPYAYAAGDRVFVTYNYNDLTNASCNIILTCRDN